VTLRLESAPPVVRLLIDRPDKRNAFTVAMFEALPGLVAQAVADPGARVILLTSGTSGMFCAGADIGELSGNADDPAWRARNQAAINKAQHNLARAEKPVVAFIDGDCVGGGCGLALACDIRIATPRARFGITPAKLGLVYPLHDTKLLVDLVGPGQAKRILMTGTMLDAAEALRIGLVDMIADSPDALVDSIAGNSSHSACQSKAMIRLILDGQTDDNPETLAMFASAFEGADFKEGVSAFLEKRRPGFQ
jgi:enoyl-CoA hydratase/carnithine racemase